MVWKEDIISRIGRYSFIITTNRKSAPSLLSREKQQSFQGGLPSRSCIYHKNVLPCIFSRKEALIKCKAKVDGNWVGSLKLPAFVAGHFEFYLWVLDGSDARGSCSGCLFLFPALCIWQLWGCQHLSNSVVTPEIWRASLRTCEAVFLKPGAPSMCQARYLCQVCWPGSVGGCLGCAPKFPCRKSWTELWVLLPSECKLQYLR